MSNVKIVASRYADFLRKKFSLRSVQGKSDRDLLNLISSSDFFCSKYYLEAYPDLASVEDLAWHYVCHGASEMRNPSAHFNTKYYSDTNPDIALSGMNPLEHYIKIGRLRGLSAVPTKTSNGKALSYGSLNAERCDGLFDPSYYLMNNADVAAAGIDPFEHYSRYGWKECRNPSAAFDVIWYVQAYLQSDWSCDPLHHYVEEGRGKGYLPKPPLPISFQPSTSYTSGERKPRRICIFAGYDPDGLIDPVAIEYIADLAQHADVYYLADCHVASTELAKLHGITKGAWAHRHGRYDFGSWSLLAQKFVGWDLIGDYDELILANDSCYLMRSFDDVFAEMDGRDCDWWGLQATKGVASTFARQRVPAELDLDEVKADWLARFEVDATYDFLVGSYFLVLRKPVLSDGRVRDFLNNVSSEKSKMLIIRKYEIGLTRLLISFGYDFECYVRKIYPHQPIFTDTCFQLIQEGFPLLKKYHLVENHYNVPTLGNWKSRVLEAGVSKCLDAYESHLFRTGDSAKLYKSFDVEVSKLNPPLSHRKLVAEDKVVPKYDDWWAFPVCSYSGLFNDNIRALFEHVKDDLKIKKIILTRNKSVDVDGVNVEIYPLNSREGQFYLLRSRHVFLKHGVRSNLGVNLSPKLHCFHNLWHGIPLKQIGYASFDNQPLLDYIVKENEALTSVIAASKVDRNAMAVAYWPLTVADIWVTGLPRHDLIMKSESLLPKDMREQLALLRNMLGGRKLILFAPTFRRDQQGGYYSFTNEERLALASLMARNNYVLGVREHMADKERQYTSKLYGDDFISVPESLFPCVEMLLREAAIVATDYSSTFIDFLLTERPVISFAYDFDHYVNNERGLFYDLDWSFPGKIAKNFEEFLSAVSEAINGMSVEDRAIYDQRRRLFIENYDDANSERVTERVKALKKGDVTIFDVQNRAVVTDQVRTILWVYDCGSEMTARYRIFNITSEIAQAGWKCRIVTSAQLHLDHLAAASIIVFCRVSGDDRIVDMAEGCRRVGKTVIFDIDDPLFDREILQASEYYVDRPMHQAALRLLGYRFEKLMACANLITVSTPALARLAEERGMTAVCVPNSINSSLIAQYGGIHSHDDHEDGGDVVRICYLSGSKTHGSDFDLVRQAATKIMAECDSVEFHLVGEVSFVEGRASALMDGWVCHPHMSYDAMHAFLAGMDINLAPLTLDAFNDCKSELKLFEAGLHSVPSIASPTEPYAAFIEDGVNGYLARTAEDWYRKLSILISDAQLRSKFGSRARDDAINKHASQYISSKYIRDVIGNVVKGAGSLQP